MSNPLPPNIIGNSSTPSNTMNSVNPMQQSSRSSTGALSQQSTLAATHSRTSTMTPKVTRPPSEAFQKAHKKFLRRLTADEEVKFRNTTYNQLCYDMAQLQNDQERRKEMMHLSRIQAFLEGMHQLSKTIEIFLNVSEFVAFAWGPIKFLLLTASNHADSFETLLDAYEKIGDELPHLSEYESLFGDNDHLVDALQAIYIDILLFHQHAIRFFQGKTWIRFFKSMWKDFDTEFGGILKSLRRHKELVECRASLAQYGRYKEDMLELMTKLNKQVEEEKLKKLMAVKEWLAVGQQPEQDHVRFQKTRNDYSRTALWILDHEYVKHWMEADIPTTPLLWMHGIPGAGKISLLDYGAYDTVTILPEVSGAVMTSTNLGFTYRKPPIVCLLLSGKTILASAIVDGCKQKADFKSCYFYCHDGDQTSNTAIGILKGLVDQLLDQHPDLLPPCYSRRTSSGEPVLRSLHQAKTLFEDCCLAIPKLFVVVDGLDECEQGERKHTLDIFMDIVSRHDTHAQGKLRVLIVSQDYSDIRRGFHTSSTNKLTPRTIQLSDTDVEADISTYVKVWVDRIALKFSSGESPFTDDMRDYLHNLTVANAKGMFLYASLVMQNLFQQPTREDMINAIRKENFPRGLEEAYERILQRIKLTSHPDEWVKAKKLLGWMVCAKRQLTWKEIQVALSINVEDQTIDYDDKSLRTHIHDICGSLVLRSGDRVTLVHSTAKTYLTKISKDIHEPSIECDLAILCLQYLTFPCFQKDGINDQQLQEMALRGDFAFQDYAVAKWLYHVNTTVAHGKRLLNEVADVDSRLDNFSTALDFFMAQYDDEKWEAGLVEDCRSKCNVFEDYPVFENLLLLTSHIYTFQQKGFEARHKISIKGIATALERSRKTLEELPAKLDPAARTAYERFYDIEKRYKCTKITCRYFSEGFKDAKARKKHVNIHDRPFQCEVSDCLGAEGFANPKDLEKHTRAFHPEMSDLAERFNSATIKREKSDHACTICGKTFTRNFHRRNHELSHRGERPHECPECGKAFTRLNDMKRHQKLHERGK